jgi:trans-aconitate 2-methyltransferase
MPWDPESYLQFRSERDRPCLDLIARIPGEMTSIADLGCGPGNSTAMLRARWPHARITGIDNSKEMLRKAAAAEVAAEWLEADVSAWRPRDDIDLIFSNATFHWVKDQRRILPELASCCRVFAMQIPFHLQSPAHRAMAWLCEDPRFERWLTPKPDPFEVLTPQVYYDLLAAPGRTVEIWQTTYYHAIASPHGIVEFLSPTGLRPFLDRLPEEEKENFREAFGDAVAELYPAQGDGRVLFPFPRLFVLATAQ